MYFCDSKDGLSAISLICTFGAHLWLVFNYCV